MESIGWQTPWSGLVFPLGDRVGRDTQTSFAVGGELCSTRSAELSQEVT